MKTSHLLILCCSITVIACTTTIDPGNESINDKQPLRTDLDTVWMDQATQEIASFESFQQLIPAHCSWDSATATLQYSSQIITGPMADSLNKWFRKKPRRSLPFPKDHATSYFIPYDDIVTALDQIDPVTGQTKGLRMFLAMRPSPISADGNDHSFSSHTLITPAHRILEIGKDGDTENRFTYYDDTLTIDNGKSFLLDLTTPCPLACPTNSIFTRNLNAEEKILQ